MPDGVLDVSANDLDRTLGKFSLNFSIKSSSEQELRIFTIKKKKFI